jgi:catechol 2,3-dioxygenase-like lactoylglutathione lyase family enzyme
MADKVEGIGGVVFRAKDPQALAEWYERHLGVANGLVGTEVWRQQAGPTILAPMTDFHRFGPNQGVMLNFRVADLDRFLDQLQAEGIEMDDGITVEAGAGRFAWITDPEGNTVELWEPEAGL